MIPLISDNARQLQAARRFFDYLATKLEAGFPGRPSVSQSVGGRRRSDYDYSLESRATASLSAGT